MKLRRPCLDCGALVRDAHRCLPCAAERDKRRGTRQQRGYDAEHDRTRAQWAPQVATGRVPCARCGVLIAHGAPWDLGHADDRTSWSGPEHAACNRAAGGKAAHHG